MSRIGLASGHEDVPGWCARNLSEYGAPRPDTAVRLEWLLAAGAKLRLLEGSFARQAEGIGESSFRS